MKRAIEFNTRYVLDADISERQDSDIRGLLSLCFGESFLDKRCAQEMPAHRWLVYKNGALIGHLAAHEKTLTTATCRDFDIAGISEVCVHPDYRLQGVAWLLLSTAHRYLTENLFDFALLFGDERVYKSSGYELKTIDYSENNRAITISVLVRSLCCADFPAISYLPGPRF